MWGLNTIDQSELQLSSGKNLWMDGQMEQMDRQRDSMITIEQGPTYKLPIGQDKQN